MNTVQCADRQTQHPRRTHVGWRGLTMCIVLLLLAAACGGGAETTAPEQADGSAAPGAAPQREGSSVIRFAFAPDPVMDYLIDTGTLAEFEEAWGVRLEMTSSWDEFAFFAGGHGDIVSMSTLDIPLLQQETGVEVVGFGKYNHTRLIIGTKCDSGYETMEDLVGKRFGVGNPVTTERLVGTIVNTLHEGITFSLDGGDYEIVYNDHPVLPELIARGEIDAAYMIPEFGVPYLRSGEICGLYEDRAAFELYRDLLLDGEHEGLESNLFVAEKEWFENHPYEVQFFMALWEEGVNLWYRDHTEIVGLYPQHFSVESEEDISYIDEWIQDHQFIADTVYLDDDWIAGEEQIFDLAKEADMMEQDAANPRLDSVERAIPDDIDMAAISQFADEQ